jgi:hypothetical protein
MTEPTQSKYELDTLIFEAVNESNPYKAREAAERLKDCGDDEEAERLISLAKKWEGEEWGYDESINN